MFIFLDPDQYVYLPHTMNFLFSFSARAKDSPRFETVCKNKSSTWALKDSDYWTFDVRENKYYESMEANPTAKHTVFSRINPQTFSS